LKLKFPTYFVEIHNFGSPRVGNPSFAQFVMAKVDAIYRVVHNRDLVPHVPFTPLNYAHPAY
jgi:predicted lipase